jgi:hypothetical protein
METSRDRAQRSSLHPQPGEGNTCSNQSRIGHLQQVRNKPWVREGTQLDLPDKSEIKDTKDHARLMRWASLTQLHKGAYESSDQFELSIKFITIYLSTRLAPVLEKSLIRSKQY